MSGSQHPEEPDEAFNLVEIAQGLRRLESTGGRAALELKRLRIAHADARKALREAKARAMNAAPDGTVQMKNAFIDEQTSDIQYQAELAKIEVEYGVDMVEERRSERSSLQTRAKLAMEAMRLAGYGGGA